MKKILFITAIGYALSGCSASISAYKNRAISKHGTLYKEKFENGQVMALTGDRRLAIGFPEKPSTPFKFCAESIPDAAAAIGAASSLKVSDKIEAGDSVSTGLLQTFNRTENAELFRAWSFTMCSAWAQGAITTPQYHESLSTMTGALAEVMKTNATKGITYAAPGSTIVVGTETPTPKSTSTPTSTPAPTGTPAPSTPSPTPTPASTPTPKPS